jgi:SAM-dependent methyltransferase
MGPSLKAFKHAILERSSRFLWARYSLLAPYLALKALKSTLNGSTTSGATHSHNDLDRSITYVDKVFRDYQAVAPNCSSGCLAEIGTGDCCGVGLLFLAHGFDEVDLIDRFYTPRNDAHQCKINQELVRRYPELRARMLDEQFSESSFRGLTRYYGPNAAGEKFFKTKTSHYSAIVSTAVLEHLYDPLAVLTDCIAALRPGGIMIHAVDCRDHDLFSKHFHDLAFLQFPDLLFAPFKWNGGPNRLRLSSYTKTLDALPVDYSIFPILLAGVKEQIPFPVSLCNIDAGLLDASRKYVAQVRPRLAKRFQHLPDEDLMVQAFYISARKR